MNFATAVALIILAAIISLAVVYIVREKKRGSRCIGCPYSDSCTRYGDAKERGQDCGQGRAQ